MPARSSGGFSLIELVIAMGLFVAVAAAALGLLKPGHGVFAVQSEVADMQQRARAAFEALSRDLAEKIEAGDSIEVKEKSREMPLVLLAIESGERDVPLEHVQVGDRLLACRPHRVRRLSLGRGPQAGYK